MEESLKICPPFKLAVGDTNCYRCGATFPAVAVLGMLSDGENTESAILSYMKDPPESILTHIRQHALAFRKVYSQTAECEYYANVCPRCDAFAGDHFLHAPSSVFFPTDERDVEQLRIVDVPIAEPMTIVADAGFNTWVSRVFD